MAAVLETLHIDSAGCTLEMPVDDFLEAYVHAPVTVLNDGIIYDDDAIRGALMRVYSRALTPGAIGDAILLRYEANMNGEFFAQAIEPVFGPVVAPNLANAIVRELGIDDFFTVEDPDNIIFLKEDGSNFYINRETLVNFLNTFVV